MKGSVKGFLAGLLLAGTVVAGGLAVTSATAGQAHMREAMQALRAAQQQLAMAVPDKAGHREKALDLVKRAIHQTQQGIRAGAI